MAPTVSGWHCYEDYVFKVRARLMYILKGHAADLQADRAKGGWLAKGSLKKVMQICTAVAGTAVELLRDTIIHYMRVLPLLLLLLRFRWCIQGCCLHHGAAPHAVG